MEVKFFKYHGIGNDFIIIDALKEKIPENISELSRKLCHRNFGIGADGLIIVHSSDSVDIRMQIINSDGSEAEMCGNGIRCFAKYVYENKYVKGQKFTVETLAGTMIPEIILKNGEVSAVIVDMGEPSFKRKDVPMLGEKEEAIDEPLEVLDKTIRVTSVLMGVPHCVVFVDDLDAVDLSKYGPALEKNPVYPQKTNVHFVKVINENELKMRIWERGAGITLACGTGACGSLVAAVRNNKTNRNARVELPGGVLNIEWASNNHVYMTGPAEFAFSGEIPIK